MKKRSTVYIKKRIGIFLMIFGIFIIASKKVFTGAVIGVSNVYYFVLIGFLIFLVGAFLSLEDIITGFKKRREERKRNLFGHRLRMARVFEPINYVFNDNIHSSRSLKKDLNSGKLLRKELKKIEYYSEKEEEKHRKEYGHTFTTSPPAYYSPSHYKFPSKAKDKPDIYAHELIHKLSRDGLIDNDYVIANAVDGYMKSVKEYKKEDYAKVDIRNVKPHIRKIDNLRPLTKKEMKDPSLERSPKTMFWETGRDVGEFAAYVEGISKITGAGLYLIKLVSRGLSPEKARDIVLGDYDPLKKFQQKYGKRWKRILA
ncbi:MAG: DUF308 domain-containing protein [Nanoarchaeota archaeon]